MTLVSHMRSHAGILFAFLVLVIVLILVVEYYPAEQPPSNDGTLPVPGLENNPGNNQNGTTLHAGIHREEAEEIKEFWEELYNPDLEIRGVVDKSIGEPGDLLTYTLNITNIGTGPAKDIHLASTYPDGTSERMRTGDLEPGASENITMRYRIPTGVEGRVLMLSVTVTAKNLRGDAEQNEGNNAIHLQTGIHVPGGGPHKDPS